MMGMNEDFLDPDRHLWNQEDYLTPILEALKEHDSGRGWNDKINVCLTDKNADLEQVAFGIEVISADDEKVYLKAHGLLTVAGQDVCLNIADEAPEEQYEGFKEQYLDEAGSIVMGAALQGDWNGDGWTLWFEEDFTVDLVDDEEIGEPDFKRTAELIVVKSWAVGKNGLDEMEMVSVATNKSAGWT